MSLSSIKIQPLQRFSLNFAANLIAVFYMLIGSTKAFDWVKPTLMQFLFFALLALGANVLFAWLVAEQGSVFNEQGLISYLIWPMLMLLAGIIIARHSSNYSLLFVPVILWLTADMLMMLLQSLLQGLGILGWLPDWSYSFVPTLFVVLFLWQTVALLWIFSRNMQWSWLERIVILFAAIAVLVVWQVNVSDQPIFKTVAVEPVLDEAAFYKQPDLLDKSLESIDKNTLGQTDWFFMGVAGFSEQNVFRSEISQLRQLFDVRFGTAGHSLALINNKDSWLSEPIATKTSIERGLKRISQQMNPDEDVLFMAISSHGGDKVVELSNPPLALENLDASWLRKTLDDAGIRWRVLVISACYSGSFIDELQSPTTVIITASRADRASFGCSNDADLTYFGRAFFAESLRENTSFVSAFQNARKRIAEREGKMGFEPSEPQMVVGSLMKTALPAFEQSLFHSSIAYKPIEDIDLRSQDKKPRKSIKDYFTLNDDSQETDSDVVESVVDVTTDYPIHVEVLEGDLQNKQISNDLDNKHDSQSHEIQENNDLNKKQKNSSQEKPDNDENMDDMAGKLLESPKPV